jgi:hypothetical protein
MSFSINENPSEENSKVAGSDVLNVSTIFLRITVSFDLNV